jgi:hypothetical protein
MDFLFTACVRNFSAWRGFCDSLQRVHFYFTEKKEHSILFERVMYEGGILSGLAKAVFMLESSFLSTTWLTSFLNDL